MHRALTAFCVLLLAPAALAAQADTALASPGASPAAADSLPFRAGQWGAEFGLDNGVFGLGALRFGSARSAWLLDASFSASWSEQEMSMSEDRETRSTFVGVRTGPRRYRPLGPDVASYAGAGVLGSYSWQDANGDDFRGRSWQAGLYAELGAAYFVTDRLSLGAQASAAAAYYSSYSVSRFETTVERTERRLQLSTTRVRIVGGLYF
jgi:hypothetical protein